MSQQKATASALSRDSMPAQSQPISTTSQASWEERFDRLDVSDLTNHPAPKPPVLTFPPGITIPKRIGRD